MVRDMAFFTTQTAKAFRWATPGMVLTAEVLRMIEAQVALMCSIAYHEGVKGAGAEPDATNAELLRAEPRPAEGDA